MVHRIDEGLAHSKAGVLVVPPAAGVLIGLAAARARLHRQEK